MFYSHLYIVSQTIQCISPLLYLDVACAFVIIMLLKYYYYYYYYTSSNKLLFFAMKMKLKLNFHVKFLC